MISQRLREHGLQALAPVRWCVRGGQQLLLAGALVGALAVVACGSNSNKNSNQPAATITAPAVATTVAPIPSTAGSRPATATPAVGTATVQVRQTPALGAVLTTAAGKTLYAFSLDTAGTSTCTGACATAWPPLLLTLGNPVAPPGLPGALGTITRSDGTRQVTYKGQPLYTFARDALPGDTTGDGVTAFNGTWHVVHP